MRVVGPIPFPCGKEVAPGQGLRGELCGQVPELVAAQRWWVTKDVTGCQKIR